LGSGLALGTADLRTGVEGCPVVARGRAGVDRGAACLGELEVTARRALDVPAFAVDADRKLSHFLGDADPKLSQVFYLPCCFLCSKGMKRVITMDMIGKIRRMHRRDKKTKREISRATGLSRNTVAKWLDEAQPVEPKYRREAAKATKLSAHEAELKQALKADAKRPKKERRTAKALFTQIKAAGYEGGYTRVTDFIRKWRQGEGQQAACKAFVPLTFELGEAFQFDWSEDGLLVGGVYYRMQVSHMKLCASRAFWLVAYPSQGHEMLFDAHTRSFAGAGRRGTPWHLRQHEDGGGQGQEGQRPRGQCALCGHVRALPVRP
jgi:hypothetical protein